ncbi:trihelix transcription factor GT-2-like isoform X2 [Cucurbita maxima]|uniref:Trihelix transcription factor GT-2-like isoform X2 n=1 Tax=Cucurbita maxima TaxID=3661 RepID=A0A6J1I6C4_CUCMA|nr:trihelix transcription factor GT-2-like isoform X2 [Cucurbita maxima]
MREISPSPEISTAVVNRASEEEVDRNWAGNRWPREETMALLKVRSRMDSVFRDSSIKAPLWEEVSRKLAEFGYNRSAKKCKEKFENIYKYHKRTKDGRSSKPNGKNYRYFEQLQALDNHPLLPSQADSKEEFPNKIVHNAIPCSIINPDSNFVETTTTLISMSTTSCSSKESGGTRKKKKKRKLVDFFGRLMEEVIEKQEKLQKKFVEALEKCEEERLAREEEWKMQELARIKNERERFNHERSIAAAKDAAVLSFLKAFSEQVGTVQFPESLILMENLTGRQDHSNVDRNTSTRENGNDGNSNQISSSRWPKDEINALIQLKTNLQMKYQENGPKGPLWEEISLSMKKLGYDRNAKRCKEKWENINKYFKRVKESNKKRPEDSKTCSYFQQLDALYKQKSKKVIDNHPNYELKPEELLMHMMGSQEENHQPESATDYGKAENADKNQEDDDDDDDDNNDEDEYYYIVANNNSNQVEVGS